MAADLFRLSEEWWRLRSTLNKGATPADGQFLRENNSDFARAICFLPAEEVLTIIRAHEIMLKLDRYLARANWRHLPRQILSRFPMRYSFKRTQRVIRISRNYFCHFGSLDSMAQRPSDNPLINELLEMAYRLNVRVVQNSFHSIIDFF